MEIIPNSEVFQEDKRNTKKMMLPTDAICTNCGVIFNSVYEDECVICDDYRDYCEIKNGTRDETKGRSEGKEDVEKPMIRFVEEKEDDGQKVCQHEDFIKGRQSVDLRILLDFHVDDIRALCEIHGCPEGGSRGKMVVSIMRQLHSNLDKRIDERLVRKMIIRNRRKFRFWKDIECAINRAKRPGRIQLVKADDCIEITEFGQSKNR